MKKKLLCALLSAAMTASLLVGCGSTPADGTDANTEAPQETEEAVMQKLQKMQAAMRKMLLKAEHPENLPERSESAASDLQQELQRFMEMQ